jgi:hypothetical protein
VEVDGPRREYRVVAALTAEEIIIAGRTAWPRYLFLPCEVERKREYLRYGEEHSGMKNFRTEAKLSNCSPIVFKCCPCKFSIQLSKI